MRVYNYVILYVIRLHVSYKLYAVALGKGKGKDKVQGKGQGKGKGETKGKGKGKGKGMVKGHGQRQRQRHWPWQRQRQWASQDLGPFECAPFDVPAAQRLLSSPGFGSSPVYRMAGCIWAPSLAPTPSISLGRNNSL